MKNFLKILALTGILICFNLNIFAQEDEEDLFLQLEQDDQTAIDAIAMYPAQTRVDILESSKFPEIIVRLDAMQKKTEQKFDELIAPYSKEEQEKIWNLTRYPSLISDIAFDEPKSEDEINTILLEYPEEIHNIALEEGIKNYDLLLKIAQKNKQYDDNFEAILSSYPPVTINAYRNLISQPEILNTLSDNMQMTVLIGDLYRSDPRWVLFKTDSLNEVLTQQNTAAAADWQKSLNDNPQALQEYTEAAQQYAQENNVQPNDYSTPYNTDLSNYETSSYNWWYGYPTWYPYSYWDPYPYWYDLGFYYGTGGSRVFFGMPSSHFMNWYFYNPTNWSRYPEFGNHCYTYNDNHPAYRYSNNVSRGVNEWRNRNSDVVNDDWNRDKTGRTERFREFGKMETNRNAYNSSNPHHTMERSEFANQNKNNYPTIRVSANSNDRSRNEMKAPNTKPRVNIPASFHQENSQPNAQQQRNTSPPKENQQIRGNQPDNRSTTPSPSQTPRVNTNESRNVQNAQPSSPEQRITSPSHGNQQTEGNRTENYNSPSPSQTQHFNTNESRNAQEYHQNTWQRVQSESHNSPPPTQQSAPPNRPSGGGINVGGNNSYRGGGGKRGR